MKKLTLIFALLLCIAFVPTSCKKDKVDPNIPSTLYGEWFGEGGTYSFSVAFLKDKTCVIYGVSSQTYITEDLDTWTLDCPYTYDNGHITCTGTLLKHLGSNGQDVEVPNFTTTFEFKETYLTGGIEPSIYRYTKE